MPLIQCSECGNNYPDRLTTFPKCGVGIPKKIKSRKERNIELLKYLMAGILLILFSAFIMFHVIEHPLDQDHTFFIFAGIFIGPMAFIAGVILIIAALVVYLSSIRKQKSK